MDDTVHLFADGQVDVIRCDDMDTAAQAANAGLGDQVVYIGPRDPLDVIWDSCETVQSVSHLPAGWPYGPVAGVSAKASP